MILLIKLKKFSSLHSSLTVFITHECWILSNYFSATTEIPCVHVYRFLYVIIMGISLFTDSFSGLEDFLLLPFPQGQWILISWERTLYSSSRTGGQSRWILLMFSPKTHWLFAKPHGLECVQFLPQGLTAFYFIEQRKGLGCRWGSLPIPLLPQNQLVFPCLFHGGWLSLFCP